MSTQKPILVTGAGGQIGAVGNTVTRLLLDRGKKIRAMVRRDDERAQALRDLGAEVVVGDLLDLADLYRIVEGCGSIYFGMSVSAGYLAATANIAAVARHHGIDVLVNMSQLTVSQMSITETTDSPQHKLHWLAEQILNWSGLPVVHMRPTVFMDTFFLRLAAMTVKNYNDIRVPFGDGKTSPIAAQDVALAVATVLMDPQPHLGKIFELTGPESADMSFFAGEFTKALGRPIRYLDAPMAAWQAAVQSFGITGHVLDHLSAMCELHKAGRYDRMTDQFKALTGRAPMTVRDFVTLHAQAFTADA